MSRTNFYHRGAQRKNTEAHGDFKNIFTRHIFTGPLTHVLTIITAVGEHIEHSNY